MTRVITHVTEDVTGNVTARFQLKLNYQTKTEHRVSRTTDRAKNGGNAKLVPNL